MFTAAGTRELGELSGINSYIMCEGRDGAKRKIYFCMCVCMQEDCI